jgi:hypothetical protein
MSKVPYTYDKERAATNFARRSERSTKPWHKCAIAILKDHEHELGRDLEFVKLMSRRKWSSTPSDKNILSLRKIAARFNIPYPEGEPISRRGT